MHLRRETIDTQTRVVLSIFGEICSMCGCLHCVVRAASCSGWMCMKGEIHCQCNVRCIWLLSVSVCPSLCCRRPQFVPHPPCGAQRSIQGLTSTLVANARLNFSLRFVHLSRVQ